GDGGDVDVAARAEADPPEAIAAVVGVRLAQRGGHFDAVDGAGEVDEAVGQVEVRAGPGYHLVGDGEGGQFPAGRDLQGAQHLGQQLEARDRLLLVHAHRHLPGVDARLQKLGGDAQRFRVGRGVTEAAGVGEDAGVDAGRRVARWFV